MGALRSNEEDLLRFLAANVGEPSSQIERSMRDAQEPRNTASGNTDIGLNFHIMKFGDRRIITHGGATRGFRAFVGFDPDSRVGAVVLANSPIAIQDIGLHLINPEVPLRDAEITERTEIDLPVDILEPYVGEYEMRSTFVVDITLEDGGLYARGSRQDRFQIFPESETRFFARSVNVQIEFARDDAGVVSGLVLHQNGRSATAPRRPMIGVPLAREGSLPGEQTIISSAALGGDRPLRIIVPSGYELSISSLHPVMVVLDGDPPIPQVAGVASALAGKDGAPSMIVVHTPAPNDSDRASFASFLDDELAPWMEREYRPAPLVLVAGEAETIALLPESFARIAVASNNALIASFDGRRFASEEAEDPHAAVRNALTWLFADWGLPEIATLASQPGDEGWASIDVHYARLSERFGYRVVPHEDVADEAARVHARAGRWNEAVREMERNTVLHSGSARTWNHLGDLLRALCRAEESRTNYAKAYELASEMKYDNVSNYAGELNRIKTEIENGRPCSSPAEERAEVEVEATVLQSYAGTYEFSPRFSVVVTFESGQLWIKPTGQEKSPIHAESEKTFYSKTVPVEFTFVADGTGAVTGVTMVQGGRELTGKRASP